MVPGVIRPAERQATVSARPRPINRPADDEIEVEEIPGKSCTVSICRQSSSISRAAAIVSDGTESRGRSANRHSYFRNCSMSCLKFATLGIVLVRGRARRNRRAPWDNMARADRACRCFLVLFRTTQARIQVFALIDVHFFPQQQYLTVPGEPGQHLLQDAYDHLFRCWSKTVRQRR